MAKKSKSRPRKPSESVADKIDQELAASCLRKRREGQKPTREEMAALRRIEKAREEETRWHYYETVPKKHYLEMAGDGLRPRAATVILEQAERYGLPLRGKTINLRAVIRAFHDFLAANKYKLAAGDPEDALLAAGGDSIWLERYREEKTLLARMERLAKERQLLPREEVHEGLVRLAAILRGAGEALQRQYGEDAHRLLDDALDDAQTEIDRIFGNGHKLKGDEPRAGRRGKGGPQKRSSA